MLPSSDFTGYAKVNGTRILVRIRNGSFSTGSTEINRLLPKNLGRNSENDWVSTITNIGIPELTGKSPSEVVAHFIAKSKNRDSGPDSKEFAAAGA